MKRYLTIIFLLAVAGEVNTFCGLSYAELCFVEEALYRSPQWSDRVKKYERTVHGRQCLYFPAKSPKRLIINFSFFGDRYMMWSWFWRQTEDWDTTAYLFLKDAARSWYCGTQDSPLTDNFINVIEYFIAKTGVKREHVFTVGVSMGGYAALLYATRLGFKGAIVDLPQVIPEIWNAHACNVDPGIVIRSDIAWQDLRTLISEAKNVPHISIHYGNCEADYLAAYALIDILKARKAVFTVRRSLMPAHWGNALTRSFLEREIDYIDTQELLSIQ